MKTEIKFQTISTRAVVSKNITAAQAAEILQSNPNITQVDTPSGYFPRDTMLPFAPDDIDDPRYWIVPKP